MVSARGTACSAGVRTGGKGIVWVASVSHKDTLGDTTLASARVQLMAVVSSCMNSVGVMFICSSPESRPTTHRHHHRFPADRRLLRAAARPVGRSPSYSSSSTSRAASFLARAKIGHAWPRFSCPHKWHLRDNSVRSIKTIKINARYVHVGRAVRVSRLRGLCLGVGWKRGLRRLVRRGRFFLGFAIVFVLVRLWVTFAGANRGCWLLATQSHPRR